MFADPPPPPFFLPLISTIQIFSTSFLSSVNCPQSPSAVIPSSPGPSYISCLLSFYFNCITCIFHTLIIWFLSAETRPEYIQLEPLRCNWSFESEFAKHPNVVIYCCWSVARLRSWWLLNDVFNLSLWEYRIDSTAEMMVYCDRPERSEDDEIIMPDGTKI